MTNCRVLTYKDNLERVEGFCKKRLTRQDKEFLNQCQVVE